MAKLQSGTRIYGNANVDSNIFVGANVVVNTSMVFVGNSTVNSDMTSSLVQVTNSTSTANLTAADLRIGATTVVNSSQLTAAALYATTSANVASAMLANATGLYPSSNSIALGNTTARWDINANTINGSGDWTTTGNVTANNANTIFDLTVGRNLTVSGNLTIIGSATVLQGNAITFSDNMLYLNQGILATITGASGNGTYVDFTANNNFQVGWDVFVSGVTPSSYNGNYQNIFAANSTHFTVANTNTDTYTSGGTARGKTDQNPDLGIAAGYNDGTYHHTGIFRDASDGYWKVFDGYAPEPDAAVNIDTSNLTFSIANFWANSINFGNTSVYSTANSTTFSGTSNNTSFVGSVSAANVVSNAQLSANLGNYQTTAGLSTNVATLTANNTSFVGAVSAANVVSNAQLSGNLTNYTTTTALTNNLANYQTTAGLSTNVATLTANNTSFVGAVSAANVVSNAQLSANLGNYQTTAGLSANVATLTANNATYLNSQLASYYTNATNITTGTLPYAQIPANIINTTADFTISGVHTYSANVVLGSGLSANGGFGTAGQVLTSNGTIGSPYWAAAAAGVNLNSTYAWNNNHTWSAAANLTIGTGTSADTRFFVNTYWTTDTSTTAVYVESRDNNTALTATRNRYGIYSSLNNRSQNKNIDGVTVYNSNYRAVVGDAVSASSTSGGNAFASELIGGNFRSYNYANGSAANGVNAALGTRNQAFSYGTGTILNAYGSQNQVLIGNSTATGNITTAYGVYSEVQSNTAATIATGYNFYGAHTGATTTNKFGLFVTGEANNYMSGNLVVGGSINSASYAVGTSFVANTTRVTVSGIPVYANGGAGTGGQVLTSNGTTGSPYWSTVSGGGSVDVNAQYIWTNTHTFQNTITFSSIIAVGANVSVNTSMVFVGNSTVNADLTSALLQIANSTSTANLTASQLKIGATSLSADLVQHNVFGTVEWLGSGGTGVGGTLLYKSSGTNDFYLETNGTFITHASNGNVGIANLTPDAKLSVTGTANVSANVRIGGTTTLVANVVLGTTTITANGGVGTAGQVLTSGATGNVYWTTATAAVNVANTFAWTNTHSFAANVTFNANVALAATLSANGSQGVSGQVLTAGTLSNTYWSTLSMFSTITIQELISGTGAAYAAPGDLQYAIVFATGGGGGGGGADVNDTAAGGGGGGGGAGGTAIGAFTAAQMTGATYTIGAGGTGGSGTSGTNGTAGGTTTFTPTGATALSAAGGGLGTGSGLPAVGASAEGGSGGTIVTGGSVQIYGGDGSRGVGDDVGEIAIGGTGGSSYWGGGGRGGTAQGAQSVGGVNGLAFGSGGGGGSCVDTTTGQNGGNGNGGIIVVVEFRG